jgi:hypothetical protein
LRHFEIVKIDCLKSIGTANTDLLCVSGKKIGFVLKRICWHHLDISICRSWSLAAFGSNGTSCDSTLTWSCSTSRRQILEHGRIPWAFANLEAIGTVVNRLFLLKASHYLIILKRKSVGTN